MATLASNTSHQLHSSLIGNFSIADLKNGPNQVSLQNHVIEPPKMAQMSAQSQHPQLWCGDHSNNGSASNKKNSYNYGTGKDEEEKTPMCRIAELARYNKLKHEYILMDESGPAHKKRFTVKLVLKSGEEFQGSGASIKKAQQSAALAALEQTTLQFPPQRVRKKKDEFNPVVLLYQVASRLSIRVECFEDTIRQTNVPKSPVKLPICTPPPMCFLPPNNNPIKLSGSSNPFANTENGLLPYPGNLTMPPPSLPATKWTSLNALPYFQPGANFQSSETMCSIRGPNLQQNLPPQPYLPQFSTHFSPSPKFGNHSIPNATYMGIPTSLTQSNIIGYSSSACPIFPASTNSYPPPFLRTPTAGVINSGISIKTPYITRNFNMPSNRALNHWEKTNPVEAYKIVIRLSDGSEHTAIGPNKQHTKCNAATKALFHLRPQLEEFESKLLNQKKNGDTDAILNDQKHEKPDVTQKCGSIESSDSSTSSRDSTDSPNQFNHQYEHEDEDNGYPEENESESAKENQPETNQQKRRKKCKSVISQIHEQALRLKMNVDFEILAETGEPHNRRYALRCKLSLPNSLANAMGTPVIADGSGSSKKAAKQDACKKILEQLKCIENDPLHLAATIVKSEKRHSFGSGSKELKRKTIIKDKKMDPDYGHHINPVSRLIQVMQIRNEPEPVFKLLGEQGQSRYKVFVAEVTCQEFCEQGTGPNKKLAKRAAAEAMLQRIGYVKPMPQPGKSLLKKKINSTDRSDSQESPAVEIGVFDPNEFSGLADGSTNEQNSTTTALNNSTLSSKPHDFSTAMSIETFADVENLLMKESPTKEENWEEGESWRSPVPCSNGTGNSISEEPSPVKSSGRRVTFSNEVSACPPPDDDSYPAASITPLKSEVVLVNKIKKRGKDSKRSLTAEEKHILSSMSRLFISYHTPGMALNANPGIIENPLLKPVECVASNNGGITGEVLSDPFSLIRTIHTPKEFLDVVSKSHKFTVTYSDFPKVQNSTEEQCFSLVTLGLEKPIVCPGNGTSEEAAHNDAAHNAVKGLTMLDCAAN